MWDRQAGRDRGNRCAQVTHATLCQAVSQRYRVAEYKKIRSHGSIEIWALQNGGTGFEYRFCKLVPLAERDLESEMPLLALLPVPINATALQ